MTTQIDPYPPRKAKTKYYKSTSGATRVTGGTAPAFFTSAPGNVKFAKKHRTGPATYTTSTASRRAQFGGESSDSEISHGESPDSDPSNRDGDEWSVDSDGASSDEESLTGFPFHPPTIHESTPETLNEDDNSVDSSSRQGLPILQSSPDRDVFNIEFCRYRDEDESLKSGSDQLSAELFNAVSSTSKTQTIFRWIQMKQDAIDFGTFARTVKDLPGLTEQDKREIEKVFDRVKRVAIKPFRTRYGPRGRLMEPILSAKAVENRDLDTRDDYLFFSMPYFQLEKYIQSSLPDHSHLHPPRPLIQSQYLSTTMQRELRQAVCRLPGAKPDHCFHIEVFWCMVIRDKYIVTYSRQLSASELHRDAIEMKDSPAPQPPGMASGRQEVLQVVDKNALFLVPLTQCDSWFKFIQLFYNITLSFDDHASVFWKGRNIDSTHWATVIKQAQKQPTRVYVTWRDRPVFRRLESSIIDLDDNEAGSQVGTSRPATPVDDNQPRTSSPTATPSDMSRKGHRAAASSRDHLRTPELLSQTSSRSPMSIRDYLREFHVLQWIAIRRVDSAPDVDQAASDLPTPRISLQTSESRGSLDERVGDYLKDLHKYMDTHQDPTIRKPYRKCASKSLKQAEQALLGMAKGNLDSLAVINMKKEFLTAAKTIFLVFLPRDQEALMCSKYWGAVHAVITGTMRSSDKNARKIIGKLTLTAKRVIPIQAQLSRGKGPDPLEVKLPSEFVKAWIHLLTCYINWHLDTMGIALKHARKCELVLAEAYHLVLGSIDGKPLLELRAVLPSDLLVFLAKRLLNGVTGEQDTIMRRIGRTLINWNDPLNRSHQAEISGLLDEINIVDKHLKEQEVMLRNLHNTLGIPDRDHVDQYHMRVLLGAMHSCGNIRDSLDDVRRRTYGLAGESKENIESNKQRQEAALYAFTVVTIVFLPISTVSSIFGMNTQDIREMEYGQWVFWAAVIPVTVVVVGAALFSGGVLSFNGKAGSWGQKRNVMAPGPGFPAPPPHVEYADRRHMPLPRRRGGPPGAVPPMMLAHGPPPYQHRFPPPAPPGIFT